MKWNAKLEASVSHDVAMKNSSGGTWWSESEIFNEVSSSSPGLSEVMEVGKVDELKSFWKCTKEDQKPKHTKINRASLTTSTRKREDGNGMGHL